MGLQFHKREVALAVVALIGSMSMSVATDSAVAQSNVTVAKLAGKYVAGDFHNHTTCSDGALSMQKLVKKATATWGLDWFVQAGHGGNGNRNCTLTEDASLGTPNFPFTNQGPTTTWATSLNGGVLPAPQLKGDGAAASGNMWRWQSLQSFQYQLIEDQAVRKSVPLFLGMESVVAGHEHTSMSVITGQMPSSIDALTNGAGVNATLGNADALAQWSYCFDRGDTDLSRGTTNLWDCSIGSPYAPAGVTFNATAKKITSNSGTAGHLKTVEAVKWMKQYHGAGSYYVPAHLERAGPFNASGSNGFNVEHLRDFNNAGPDIAFGMETQPGHGASSNRGEYQVLRNGGFPVGTPGGTTQDSVGGTTYGGTGVYGAQIGGVWDALLSEGRKFWFFASSDWHNRGVFGPDDRRSTQDFQPGEYQRNYALVRNGADKLRPQTIVDGLRSGNNFASSGQLIDRLSFIVCQGLTEAQVQALAVAAASSSTAVDSTSCANMGEKLALAASGDVVVGIVVRDPAGLNNSPYSFPNPSLLQVSINQPLNAPVLHHVDLIGGDVTSKVKISTDADYAGAWPSNTAWLDASGNTPATGLAVVPPAAKNTTAAKLKTFGDVANFPSGAWASVTVDGQPGLAMTYTVTATKSQYFRLRGTNLPKSVPYETDADGNPLSDIFTNANNLAMLMINCTATGSNVPALGGRSVYTGSTGPIDGCPTHLPVVGGVKKVAYDIAAWSDLWFYSNPIYVEVTGSTTVFDYSAVAP
jgi:hypothetical protein